MARFDPAIDVVDLYIFFTTLIDSRFGGQASGGGAVFSTIFAGLIVHGFFIEVLTKSPESVRSNPNLVKNRISYTNITFSYGLCLDDYDFVQYIYTAWCGCARWIPIVSSLCLAPNHLAPVFDFDNWGSVCVGLGRCFVRDLTHVTGLLGTALLFLSPIFFPMNAL